MRIQEYKKYIHKLWIYFLYNTTTWKEVESLEIYLKTLQPFIESSVISARFATDKPTKLMREIWKFTYNSNFYNFQQFSFSFSFASVMENSVA